MARGRRLNIARKKKRDILYSYEFNNVVDAINDLSYEADNNQSYVNSYVEALSYQIQENKVELEETIQEQYESYIAPVTSYLETTIAPNIEELLARSAELLNITSSNKNSIDSLLEQSAQLLGITNDHETRIMTAEELLLASQQLLQQHSESITELQNRTAEDIPSTNSNVQADIDTLLAQSAELLGRVTTIDSEINRVDNKIDTSYEKLYSHINSSYTRLYDYVEDTTLTFTIEGVNPYNETDERF